jgi:hypothetical protein
MGDETRPLPDEATLKRKRKQKRTQNEKSKCLVCDTSGGVCNHCIFCGPSVNREKGIRCAKHHKEYEANRKRRKRLREQAALIDVQTAVQFGYSLQEQLRTEPAQQLLVNPLDRDDLHLQQVLDAVWPEVGRWDAMCPADRSESVWPAVGGRRGVARGVGGLR